MGAGVCTAYNVGANPWADDAAREDDFNDLCCRPIRHLCDVPLCPHLTVTPSWADAAAEQNLNVRDTPTSTTGYVEVTIEGVAHRYAVPDCIPFPMPTQCCAGSQP